MKARTLLAVLAITLTAAAAQASVTLSPGLGIMGYGNNASGIALTNGTYVMVIDLDNDGWNGTSYLEQALAGQNNADTWQWDTDDLVVDIGQVGTFGDGMAFPFAMLNPTTTTGYTANTDHCYLLWFDKSFNASDVGPGEGVHYGAEDLGAVPADGGTLSTMALGGNATLTTVPEPATMLLMIAGGGLLAASRRRARA